MSAVTVQKLAELAGVSPATVSRCIHAPHMVRPTTLQRVQQIMLAHNYVPASSSADGAQRRSSVVAVSIPSQSIAVFAHTLSGIQEVAFEHNTPLFVGCTRYKPELERSILRQCIEQRVGGVILAGFDPSNADLVWELHAGGIPCTVLWEEPENPRICCVGIDNYRGARNALDYIVSMGHRRIAVILPPMETNNRTRLRLAAYRDTMATHKIPYDPELVFFREPLPKFAKEAIEHLLSLQRPPTAILSGCDHMALSVMSELRERGLRVPEDISLCGFDGDEISSLISPGLTSIRVPSIEVGRLGMTFLLEMMASEVPRKPRRCLLDTELVIRSSCAPPPSNR